MERASIREYGEALYGPNWKTNLARDLDLDRKTMDRWEKVDNSRCPSPRHIQSIQLLCELKARLLWSLAGRGRSKDNQEIGVPIEGPEVFALPRGVFYGFGNKRPEELVPAYERAKNFADAKRGLGRVLRAVGKMSSLRSERIYRAEAAEVISHWYAPRETSVMPNGLVYWIGVIDPDN